MPAPHRSLAASSAPHSRHARLCASATGLLMALLSTTAVAQAAAASDLDPLERVNRPVFKANDVIDRHTLRPVAVTYERYVSAEVRQVIGSAFRNLGEPFSALNLLLQGELTQAGGSLFRFGVNSTIGFLGFFDVARSAGFERRERDFGQTLGVWGIPTGPYVVLPLLGPTTLRDGAADLLTLNVLQVGALSDVPLRNTLTGSRLIVDRAEWLPVERVVDDVAIDRYAFVRDALLQRRRASLDENLNVDSSR